MMFLTDLQMLPDIMIETDRETEKYADTSKALPGYGATIAT